MKSRTLELCFLFLTPVILVLLKSHGVLDLSGWIAMGKVSLETGQLLRQDPFSILPTSELIYPSYSLSILYAWIYHLIGLKGLSVFHDLFFSGIILWLIYRPMIKDHTLPGGRVTRYVALLFWLGTAAVFVARPAMVALIPLVIAYQLSKEKITRGNLIKLLLLQIVWVNVHGSFLLLPMLIAWRGIFGLETLRERLNRAGTILLCLLACLLNPFTWKVFPFLWETAKLSAERHLSEWQMPTLDSTFPSGLIFWCLFVFWGVYLFRQFQKKHSIREIFSDPYFLLLIMGAFSTRSAAIANVMALPAAHALSLLPLTPESPEKESWLDNSFSSEFSISTDNPSFRNTAVATFLILTIPGILIFNPWKWDESVSYTLVEKIKADGRTCPIFNDWNIGSFLMLEVKNKIFIDARNIIYSREDFSTYEKIRTGGDGWKQALEGHQVCFVIVKNDTAQGLIRKLQNDTSFHLAGNDENYTLYIKNE